MKRLAIFALLVGLLLLDPLTVFASSTSGEHAGIAITVVIPRPELNQPTPTPKPVHPTVQHIYPVHVWESREDGRREIIRVYELREALPQRW